MRFFSAVKIALPDAYPCPAHELHLARGELHLTTNPMEGRILSKLINALNAAATVQQEARILALELTLKSVLDSLTHEQLANIKDSLNTYIPSRGIPNTPVDDDAIETIKSRCHSLFSGKQC